MFVIIPNMAECVAGLDDCGALSDLLLFRWFYRYNTTADMERQAQLQKEGNDVLREFFYGMGIDSYSTYCISKTCNRSDFYGTFGGLLFIGVLLSLIFLTAAVLIIYYKQLSEGYEDQTRFSVMQKVGMTKEDIKKTINSQMLTVFLLPILFAGLHIAFAFPIVNKLLMLFGLFDTKLEILITAGSVFMCAIFYAAVYKITSGVYYHIVSAD